MQIQEDGPRACGRSQVVVSWCLLHQSMPWVHPYKTPSPLASAREAPAHAPSAHLPDETLCHVARRVAQHQGWLKGGSTSSAGSSSSTPGSSEPERAHIERDRARPVLPPAGVRGRQRAGRNRIETNVSATQRVAQYPGQGFRVSNGKLLCGPCLVTLANIKSSIDAHCITAKHTRKLEVFTAKTAADIDLMSDLTAHFTANP